MGRRLGDAAGQSRGAASRSRRPDKDAEGEGAEPGGPDDEDADISSTSL